MEKIWNALEILNDISLAEKTIMNNGEHYNEMGSLTRKKIIEIASELDNGFFAEVGACMGTDTKLLEACGWNGILVEPSESLFNWLCDTRKCYVDNHALVSHNYFKNSQTITNSQIQTFSLPNYIQGYSKNSKSTFDAIPFSLLVEKYNIKKIDIFVLDVEGLEIDVLEGIDFDKVEITNFIIEYNVNSYSLQVLDYYMESKGYKNMGLVEKLCDLQLDYHYKKI